MYLLAALGFAARPAPPEDTDGRRIGGRGPSGVTPAQKEPLRSFGPYNGTCHPSFLFRRGTSTPCRANSGKSSGTCWAKHQTNRQINVTKPTNRLLSGSKLLSVGKVATLLRILDHRLELCSPRLSF